LQPGGHRFDPGQLHQIVLLSEGKLKERSMDFLDLFGDVFFDVIAAAAWDIFLRRVVGAEVQDADSLWCLVERSRSSLMLGVNKIGVEHWVGGNPGFARLWIE
jgi:hypothetical protein